MAGVPGRSGANVPEPVAWVLVYRKERATHQGEQHLVIARYRSINQLLEVKMM